MCRGRVAAPGFACGDGDGDGSALPAQEEADDQAPEAAVALRGLLHVPLRGLLLERRLLHRLPPALRLRAAHGLSLCATPARAGALRAGLCPVLR